MKNFALIKYGLDVTEALEEIKRNNLWNWLNLRRAFPRSCHSQVEDILFRGPPLDVPHTYDSLMNGIKSVDYWTAYAHRSVNELIGVAFKDVVLDDAQFGRIVCTKIQAGGKVDLHPDEGGYAQNHDRYHIVLETEPDGCEFHCGDEVVFMQPGEFWLFNHELPHEVFNRSGSDRINLIVDVCR